MTVPEPVPGASGAGPFLLDETHLQRLIDALRRRGCRVVAPVARDGAIVYEEVTSTRELPAGWTDEQAPGAYRLRRRPDGALFGYAVGPDSWKRVLHPPHLPLWRARRVNGRVELVPDAPPVPSFALLGVRACELAALDCLDDVLRDGPFTDASYRAVRERAFVVAVNCAHPAGTCFCASMDTGPRVGDGADIVLTEVVTEARHVFTAVARTPGGREVLAEAGGAPATAEDLAEAERALEGAEARMGRSLDTDGLRESLFAQPEHPQWDDVAKRCLTCGNCTLSCPTCFCTTVEDATSLRGDRTERHRRWDTCFSVEFSYMYGGSVRRSARARYRQWLTHKLSTWHDQFGRSGCVGCGRCITWCPVGIDITVEAAAIARRAGTSRGQSLTE